MKCHHCGLDNDPNFLLCAHCGHKRVIDLSGGAQPTTTAPGATPGAATGTDATRYLCAALQLDAGLNDKALQKILDEQYRAVVSSPGVDLATVLKYGLAARRRQRIRDVLIVLLALIGIGFLFSEEPQWFTLALFAGWAVMFIETLSARYGFLSAQLRRDAFDPANAPVPSNRHAAARLAEIAGQDRGNLTVFADYTPFAGHGGTIDTWSFTLNVAKAVEGEDVVEFTVQELHDFIAGSVRDLGLPGVLVEDRVFVSGHDLLHDLEPPVRQAILPDELAAPATHADDALLARLREDPECRARPYLTVRVTGWNGDLVVTMFLRFVLSAQKDLLFVEANYSLLPPVKRRYQQIDQLLRSPTARQLGRLALLSLLKIVPAVFEGVQRILGILGSPLAQVFKSLRERREITQERTFNYGATMSLREAAADNRYHRYFQQLDKEMYAKLAERRVMDALEQFLADHNVDTSDLNERQTTILNNGVYVTGQGKLNAMSVAAGTNAIARTVQAVRNAAPNNRQG
ncbi:hypothetical protein SAMN05421805_101765 [Saccharopolyspora antimicrobica]|uniref:Uncharacterized protein n=1 Tax=Saccharopolyspora antimicrobica TaxID=455193 RepID=A0A1I4RZB3_9PSEU|nr:hypothetical protein [Saccharopolyspora antimicrobica]RKT89209.1 hypothetical protein ATL45_7663 [Saccharopolyspora antimicrobica]SFM57608.1 hypothetical protein SAMN05421805_101765 [Saccharopolyspora antimicrobica]